MEKEYLLFRDSDYIGKTKKFYVVSKHSQDDVLAEIKWDCGWRQYVLWCDGCTKWSSGCLKQIQDFINKLMSERTTKD